MSVYGGPQFAASFRTVRNNTIQIAEEIPEESYGYAAAPNTRPVAKLLAHIAASTHIWHQLHGVERVTTLVGYDFFSLLGVMQAEEAKPRTKAEIIAMLKTNGEQFAAWLESLDDAFLAEEVVEPTGQGSKNRFERLLSAKEHEMHHRGQLMLIERQLGIVPHLTRNFIEMMEKMKAASGTS